MKSSSFFSFLPILKDAYAGWKKDNATVWSAALAYYTIFSLAPLLLLLLSIAGLVFTQTTVEKDVSTQIVGLLGKQGASLILTILTHAKKPSSGIIGTVISTITLLLGALGVFGQLQQMLNTIWHVEQKPTAGIKGLIRSRIWNASMVGVIAFLLIVSLGASTATAAIGTFLTHGLLVSPILLEIINAVISFLLITLLFALMFKVLPDIIIRWKYVWIGSLITSFLFTLGKEGIGIYIGHSGIASEYGAAGSLIVLLLWVYYATQIVFFGSEVTKSVLLYSGDHIVPNQYTTVVIDSSITPSKTQGRIQEVVEGFAKGVIKGVGKKH